MVIDLSADRDNRCWKRHSCQSLVYEVDSVVANASRGPSHSSASIHAPFGAIGAIGAIGGRGSLMVSAVGWGWTSSEDSEWIVRDREASPLAVAAISSPLAAH